MPQGITGLYLTLDHSELTAQLAGQRITLQYSLSEERNGLVSAGQVESGTTTVSFEDTFCWQMTFRD